MKEELTTEVTEKTSIQTVLDTIIAHVVMSHIKIHPITMQSATSAFTAALVNSGIHFHINPITRQAVLNAFTAALIDGHIKIHLITITSSLSAFTAALVNSGIHIDPIVMQSALSAFTAPRVDDRIHIDIDPITRKLALRVFTTPLFEDLYSIATKLTRSVYQNLFARQHAITPSTTEVRNQRSHPLRISDEHVELPMIPKGSKVLYIGTTGLIAKRIKDSFACDVYALEPSIERSSNFNSCVETLGKDHAQQLTLQEALEKFPEKYFQTFDVVCVFKYNILYTEKEGFIQGLAQTVTPDGVVYITSVDPGRFILQNHADTFKEHFNYADLSVRKSCHGADQLMTLSGPKLELHETLNPSLSKSRLSRWLSRFYSSSSSNPVATSNKTEKITSPSALTPRR